MHFTLVSMYRNESENVEVFMEHIHCLFDKIYLVNHLSKDSTENVVAHWAQEHGKIEHFSYIEEAYHQSELMTYITQKIASTKPETWIFYLDFDEFLPFSCKDTFKTMMKSCKNETAISMPWLNLIPNGEKIEKYLSGPAVSETSKIAIQINKVQSRPIIISPGNHRFYYADSGEHMKINSKFPLLHVPISSKESFINKVTTGTKSNAHNLKHKSLKGIGDHWGFMNYLVENGLMNQSIIHGLIVSYGETDRQKELLENDALEITLQQLLLDGWSELGFSVAKIKLRSLEQNKLSTPLKTIILSPDEIIFDQKHYNPSFFRKKIRKLTNSITKRICIS